MSSAPVSKNMAEGSIARWMLNLAAPAVVAQVINLLYNVVDRIYIGHMPGVGATALTGVGLCMPILMLVNAFAMLAGATTNPPSASPATASPCCWASRWCSPPCSMPLRPSCCGFLAPAMPPCPMP